MCFSSIRRFVLSAVVILASACASDVAYRTAPSHKDWEACFPDGQCSGESSVELQKYESRDGDKVTAAGSYLIGFVEFDDQGWFHDDLQRTALFKALESYRKDGGKKLLIVVYAHGWKHNAGHDDLNVKEFRKLLERLDTLEQRLAGRKVVGVYLGWRGASVTIPFLENATFWTRKNSGERVGDGSVKQLLMELNEYRAYTNGWGHSDQLANREETQLILIGHSFGGMLMYRALHAQLMERAIRIEKIGRDSYRYDMAKSFGDFILLVNPAFEGSSYEALLRAATSRCYSDDQRPVMAVITSQGDWATKYAFPLGRLYTYAHSTPHDGEREAVLNTVGHLPRYITHELKYAPDSAVDNKSRGLSPTTPAQAEQILSAASRGLKEAEQTGLTKYDGATVKKIESDLPADFPYLVMSADPDLIADHGDIWNDRFAKFMVSFIANEVMALRQQDSSHRGNTRRCAPFGQK